MQKQCKCGKAMTIRLRTVIYQNKVEIENVPIYSCGSCSRSEVFPEVKPELTGLIGTLGSKPGKQQMQFEDISEIAHLMVKVTEKKRAADPVEMIIDERINELLDLLLLAQSLEDEAWIADLRKRLSQIASRSLTARDF
ncbi:hypothetical protein [Paenibacillus solanacearum]|uniref:hypothetical protein n=1 Tax=Paenibacillus solanacearum TaxID=2048548 RepID=UPI001C402A2A|nr:hypothetical protein [Paenibacillus solanacearum]